MSRRIMREDMVGNEGRYIYQNPKPGPKGKKVFNQTKIKRHKDLRSILKIRTYNM
jgi:hypothetical protein